MTSGAYVMAIDIVSMSRNKALPWTVPIGKAHIIATGLKLFRGWERWRRTAMPETFWVLDRIVAPNKLHA